MVLFGHTVSIVRHTTETERWYRYGVLHRDNGPAIVCANGDECWYRNGKLHRKGRPLLFAPMCLNNGIAMGSNIARMDLRLSRKMVNKYGIFMVSNIEMMDPRILQHLENARGTIVVICTALGIPQLLKLMVYSNIVYMVYTRVVAIEFNFFTIVHFTLNIQARIFINPQMSDFILGVKLSENHILHCVASVHPSPARMSASSPDIVLTDCDSTQSAKFSGNICVLNFANNDIAGGGYDLKGTTQEEILLKTTNLGDTLELAHYPIDVVIDKLRYWQYEKLSLIYSPRVTFNTTTFAVITCAAINNPRVSNGKYATESDRDVTRRKIRMILDAAIMHGHDVLVAGQWGCGAFGNPLEICSIWVSEIAQRKIKVIFPVFNDKFRQEMEYSLRYIGKTPKYDNM